MVGRPEKYIISYFPHYTRDSKTLFILENKHGSDGYAFWFKLLEILCNSKGLYYDCTEEGSFEYLSAKTRVKPDIAKDILNTLAALGSIDKELWQNKVIWCQGLIDNVLDVFKRRKSDIPQRPINLINVNTNSINVNNKSINVNKKPINAPQTKLNKTKLNKIVYMEFVYLTKEEHQKLISKLGADKTNEMIESLNIHIGSKGDKYKSHYYTILSWIKLEKLRSQEKTKGITDGKKYRSV